MEANEQLLKALQRQRQILNELARLCVQIETILKPNFEINAVDAAYKPRR